MNDTNSGMNEFDFIRDIARNVPRSGEGLIQGIDDDAAVIEGPRGISWLVTTDALAEGVHFRREWAGWEDIGRKALVANISDITAMGGIPWFYFLSLSVPHNMSEADLSGFIKGIKDVASQYDMILAGGDTTASTEKLFLSITVVGSAAQDAVVYRKGARDGDKIFVTGSLGGSAAGLICLNKDIKGEKYSPFIMRHIKPQPRVRIGAWLGEHKCASSMIDISDGLVADVNHIADRSGVGYIIDAEKIPVASGLEAIDNIIDVDIKELALTSGEEYELLFTMSREQEEYFYSQSAKLDFGCQITEVGKIVKDDAKRQVLGAGGKNIVMKTTGFSHDIGS